MESAVAYKEQVLLPLGRKVPRGRSRWYMAACPVGSEQSTCDKLRACVSADVLYDAFVPRAERIGKFSGVWVTRVVDLFRGYFVVVSSDSYGLAKQLGRLTFPVWLCGAVGRGFAPIDREAQTFLEQSMDMDHVVRCSEAVIVGDELRVYDGPLVGQEARITKLDRQKSFARVRVGGVADKPFTLSLPLAVPVRR